MFQGLCKTNIHLGDVQSLEDRADHNCSLDVIRLQAQNVLGRQICHCMFQSSKKYQRFLRRETGRPFDESEDLTLGQFLHTLHVQLVVDWYRFHGFLCFFYLMTVIWFIPIHPQLQPRRGWKIWQVDMSGMV